MELTNQQLIQIEKYISSCGIKFYEVRAEIVDHFASILEQRLDENPDLDFRKEMISIYKGFSDFGFKKFLKEKTKSVQKRFYKDSLNHLITFFKLPKIIISLGLLFSLVLIMSFFEDKDAFFSLLSLLLLFLGFRLLFNVNMRDDKKETFLVLNMTMHFFNSFYLMFIIFGFITRKRVEESFLNETYNYIQIAVFVLLLLFYWSGEYVYYQNKKEVIKQYPKIFV
jgi:hypothetical protein